MMKMCKAKNCSKSDMCYRKTAKPNPDPGVQEYLNGTEEWSYPTCKRFVAYNMAAHDEVSFEEALVRNGDA